MSVESATPVPVCKADDLTTAGARFEVQGAERGGDPPMTRSDTPNEAAVWAMWLANRQRRTVDMLEMMHPDVIWVPAISTGPAEYHGHDGIRQMNRDMQAARGEYSVRLDEVTETEPDVVIAKGHLVAAGAVLDVPVTFRVEFRAGLIVRVVATTNATT